MSNLAIPKGKSVKAPSREPDLVSKRGVPWWFAPEWVRATSSGSSSYQRIKAVKNKHGGVDIYMLSKDGSLNYVQGSIQREFKDWCTDQEVDCILLGVEMDDILSTDWEYE